TQNVYTLAFVEPGPNTLAGNPPVSPHPPPPASLNLARIPAGGFLMGAADAEPDERPVHRVDLSEFFIGRYTVTNGEYAQFVRATRHPAPAIRALPLITANGREPIFRELAEPYGWRDDNPPAGRGTHPGAVVRYEEAMAYCQGISGAVRRVVRLPTEAEWERAARGGIDGRHYSWDGDFDPSRGNYLIDRAAKRQRGTQPTG